jgi:NAD(P)-dependent dehydrogenase (short-subunit alcohol dehydrogenase family)
MDDLNGRTAVVTGAASGLGLAMAARFAGAGMNVVIADIDAERLHGAAADLRAHGAEVSAVATDVTDAEQVASLADAAFARYSSVHVLCNNAGVVKRARSWELTVDDWNWVLGVDLWRVIHGLRAFVPRMLEQAEGGHVVNTASMAGLLPMPNLGAYAAAKSAVVGLSMSMRAELDQLGTPLGVSVLCPGFIATGITDSRRNRPAGLGDEAAPPNAPRTTAGTVARMTADEVADQVLDAVLTDRFWILTHDEYRPVIVEHATGIGTTARPVPAPIW